MCSQGGMHGRCNWRSGKQARVRCSGRLPAAHFTVCAVHGLHEFFLAGVLMAACSAVRLHPRWTAGNKAWQPGWLQQATSRAELVHPKAVTAACPAEHCAGKEGQQS